MRREDEKIHFVDLDDISKEICRIERRHHQVKFSMIVIKHVFSGKILTCLVVAAGVRPRSTGTGRVSRSETLRFLHKVKLAPERSDNARAESVRTLIIT